MGKAHKRKKQTKNIKEKLEKIKTKDIKLYKSILINIICVGIGVGFILGLNWLSEYNKIKNMSLDTITYNEVKISSEKKNEAQKLLRDRINNLKYNNTYLQVNIDDEVVDTYIYNKNGECYYEDSKGEIRKIFMKNNDVAIFEEYIYKTYDIDVLSMAYNILADIDGDNVEFLGLSMEENSEESDIDSFILYLNSWTAIKEMYSTLPNETALTMINNYKAYLKDYKDIKMAFEFYLLEDNSLNVTCSFIADDLKLINWYFDGHITLNDWELSDRWYKCSFVSPTEPEALLKELVTNLEKMVTSYIKENFEESSLEEEGSNKNNNKDEQNK